MITSRNRKGVSMKQPIKNILILSVLFALVPGLTFSADKTIGVVFNGSSEVNRETFMFFRKTIAQTGFSYQFTALSPTATADKSLAGVIVLNTGMASGTDPVLSAFIQKNKGLIPLVLVHLYQNQSAVTVKTSKAASSELGVDTVTSASLWGGKGAGGSAKRGERMGQPPTDANGNPPSPPAGTRGQSGGPEAEHVQWFKAALQLLSGTKA